MANIFIDPNGLRHFLSKFKKILEKKADKSELKPVALSGKYDDLTDKTHWKEVSGGLSQTVILEEQSVEVDSEGIYGTSSILNEYAVGDTLNIEFDGVLYQCEVKQSDMEGVVVYYCGSEIMFNESYSGSEPFYLTLNVNPNNSETGWGVIAMDSKAGTHTLKVYKGDVRVVTYHKLPNEYLNIDSTPKENSKNPITSDAVYRVAQIPRYLVNVTLAIVNGGFVATADKNYSEIMEAINNGYNVVAKDSMQINYSLLTVIAKEIWFIAFNENQSIKLVCSQSGWEYINTEMIVKEQGSINAGRFLAVNDAGYLNLRDTIDTDISSESTDEKMPSSKCVYELIEGVKNTIPAVSEWAKQPTKPSYGASEVGADVAGTAASAVTAHNTNTSAHNDIRLLINDITERLNALADSDDTTLDQMSEIVAYIKNNRNLIDNVTTNKVNVSDIIDNLITNVSDKPLSASQGVALKALIDAITVPTALSQLSADATHRTVTDEEKSAWNNKSNFSGSYNDLSNKPTIVIGDKTYKIVVSDTVPTVDDKSVITFVTG